MSENSRWAEGAEKRKKRAVEEQAEKVAKESYQSNNQDGDSIYEVENYTNLQRGLNVFRLVGDPADMRRENSDALPFFESEIVRDTGKSYLKVIWPSYWSESKGTYVLDENSLLYKMQKKVDESEWIKYTQEDIKEGEITLQEDGSIKNQKGHNGYYKRIHSNKRSFTRIKDNLKPNEKYPKRFYPKKLVGINTIDKSDTYCKENKKTRVLSSASVVNEWVDVKTQEPRTFNRINWGIPIGLYNSIMKRVDDFFNGSWDKMDIVINKAFTKDEKGNDAFDKYEIWDATDTKYLESVKDIVSSEPLTEEEKAYKLHNLEKIFKPTSWIAIEKHLGGLFKLFDEDFNENYYDQLQALAKKERDEYTEQNKAKVDAEVDAEKAKQDATPKVDPTPTPAPAQETPTPAPVAKEEAPIARRQPAPQAQVSTSLSIEEQCKANFPHWSSPNMTAQDKENLLKEIVSFNSGGSPKYTPEAMKDCPGCSDPTCKFPDGTDTRYPNSVMACPMCGK